MSRKTYRTSPERISECGPKARIARRVFPAGRVLLGAAVLAATVIMMAGGGTAAVAQARHHGRASHSWTQIAAGLRHTCGIRRDRTLWCWGDNFAGELGIGSTTDQDLPQQVTSPARTGWASVTPGANSTCALRTSRTLWCWGDDSFGQLGIGSTMPQDLPSQVLTPTRTGWASVTGGEYDTCATRVNGSAWCWGDNTYGQLGIGTTIAQYLPQQVR
jgi:alpha-tubulin suppressor-like RCC1 family protein